MPEKTYRMSGRIVDRKTRSGLRGLRVEAWDRAFLLKDMAGRAETDTAGAFQIELRESDFKERPPELFFKIYRAQSLLLSTEDTLVWDVGSELNGVTLEVDGDGASGARPAGLNGDGPAAAAAARTYTVSGRVASPDRAGVGGLRVEIVDKNAGPDVFMAEAVSDADGNYAISFDSTSLDDRGKLHPDLQARVYAGGTFLAASAVQYNATTHERLFVRLPASAAALPSEHETLTGALAAHYDGLLRNLKETDEQQDITYLGNKTGWDARAVALAALADRFSALAGGEPIEPAFFYALFRAGVPANENSLYHIDGGTLTGIWTRAAEQGVLPSALTTRIPQVVARFRTLSAERLLSAPALVGASSFRDMLVVSGLNTAQQTQFANLWATHRADRPAFWTAVEAAFGKPTSDRLRVDGKLGFLTLNNAPLMGALRQAVPNISDPVRLAQEGYYRPQAWGPLLTAAIPIPNEIPGDTLAAKRTNYSGYLAAQVRLSYPTASVAHMVQNSLLPVAGRAEVAAFLSQHQGEFEIGVQPVQQFVADLNPPVAPAVVTQVKRLQRMYQLTPGDQAMMGLMARGIESAHDVLRHDRESFVADFAGDVGGGDAARLIYDRALEIRDYVLNIALTYLTARNGLQIGALPLGPAQTGSGGGGPVLDPTPHAPASGTTLEDLFGEMDFCACDHCRSILSPAAYLVDLLLFIDRPTDGQHNPLTVLLGRRPDVNHLPLTCENTNTALPYIDVVNETLEQYVAHIDQAIPLNGYLGHDTGSAASEDLLASPQFVIPEAYAALRDARFPPPLPFHQPLENLRRYFKKLGVPLARAMERLRKSEEVDIDRTTTPPPPLGDYGWRDIWMEELGLSRAEYEILTDSALVPLRRLYGFDTDTDLIARLSNAKDFTRRVGISYEELVSILKTRFVNPNSDLIPKLERLGVSFVDLEIFKNAPPPTGDAAFDALLPQGAAAPDAAAYGGDIKAWVRNDANYTRIMHLIVLVDPEPDSVPDPCNFDLLEFRYSQPIHASNPNGSRLAEAEFVRLMRFIRLWKKTGWTIEQTDAAICALLPPPVAPQTFADTVDSVAELDAGFRAMLPRLGILVRVMQALNLTPKRDLLSLLAFWSPIGVHGQGALYRQMFLNPALLAQDDAFADNGYGEFLPDTAANTETLIGHADALRSAFSLTGEEYERIIADLGYDSSTRLILPTISAIFRRGYLARKLRLSVQELLLLLSLTNLDPFTEPDLSRPALLRLIALVQALNDRALKPAAALYLMWNQDLSGRSAPSRAQLAELARTLRRDFADIEDQFAVTEDPGGDIAHARIAMVYGPGAADTFFALLDGPLIHEVAYTHPTSALEGAIRAVDSRLGYDDFRHRLSYTGVLSSASRDALKGVAGVTPAFRDAVDALFHRIEIAKGLFFTRHPELEPLYTAYVLSADPPAVKRQALLAAFRPELSRRRKRQQALQRLSASAGIDLAFAQALLAPPEAPYPLHASGQRDRPGLDDILTPDTPGLAAFIFHRDTASMEDGVDLSVPAAANLDYASGGDNPLPENPVAGAAISGIWYGLIEAPEAGFYNVVVEADAGAAVRLVIGGQDRALTQNGVAWRNTAPIELTGGILYDFALIVEKVTDVLKVQWETPERPLAVIPGRALYSGTVLEPFVDTYLRFLKAASLAIGLRLTAGEMAHLAVHSDYAITHVIAGDGWLNALPARGDPADTVAAELLKPLQGLLDYARIKAGLSPNDERLLTVLKDPDLAQANGLLYQLTGWEAASLNALLNHFNDEVAAFSTPERFRRVYDAFALIRTMGISAQTLTQATTNEPSGTVARDLQAALRSRYALASWRDLIRPINDEMRGLQRDALVTYILHRMQNSETLKAIDTPDKLFEYFLMDVQMEPCMQTSRIRHALSSVQLFIERCLMNLEPEVSPASINATQWAWMKRYRVWEANRKVFLFPENWLEPELRDDKSPFFKEIESELLQGDITEDTAATALSNYLSKLEEVARLEPCGLYHVEADPAQRTVAVDHVVARTTGARRKYYYRRREGSSWTPWELINLEIEDNPVTPVVWKGRLFLFWLRILKQAAINPGTMSVSGPAGNLVDIGLDEIKQDAQTNAIDNTMQTVQALLCWSENYDGKWQPTKTSDVNLPVTIGSYPTLGGMRFDRSVLRLAPRNVEAQEVLSGAAGDLNQVLTITILGGQVPDPYFILYNTHSLPETSDYFPLTGDALVVDSPNPTREMSQFDLAPEFDVFYDHDSTDNTPSISRRVLRLTHHRMPHHTLVPFHDLADPWIAPFFFGDRHHIFFVTTAVQHRLVEGASGYGVETESDSSMAPPTPDIVQEPDPRLEIIGPQFWGDGEPVEPNLGIANPTRVRQYISRDAFIKVGLGTDGGVMFDGQKIGPSGSDSKPSDGF